jgi:hypothetical protein
VKSKDGKEILNEDSTLNPDGQGNMWDSGRDSLASRESGHRGIVDHTGEEVTVARVDDSVPIVLKDDSHYSR